MCKPVQAIEVRIWGTTVGAVALAPNLGYYAFEYDNKFVLCHGPPGLQTEGQP